MKRSERLIRSTIVGLAGLTVLYVGANRLYALGDPVQAAKRTSAADLAALRDFSAIEANGDFTLEIVRGADYSVDFMPSHATKGDFVATMRGNTLVLRGFRNAPGSRVQLALPVLTQLDAEAIPAVSLSGFTGASLSLRLDSVPEVTLRDNAIREWHVVASGVGELKVDQASIRAGKVDLAGRATLTVID